MRPVASLSCAVLLLFAHPAHAQPAERGLAAQLSEITADAAYDTLSPEVRRRLDVTVADNLAVLASATRTHCDAAFIAHLAAKGGAREALVPGCNTWLPVEDAAAAISYLIHAEEIDDSDFRAELRASAPVFAAAFATAQAEKADGAQFLTALAVGYSVQGALAKPFGPLQPRAMTSGVWGPIGAAAAASSMRGLSAEQTGAALALAASAAAGPFQYFYDQTEEKRVIIARAARAGAEAAALARRGETAAPRILEGRAGLFACIDATRTIDSAAVIADAARLDGPLYLYPKFFAASSSIIPFLEGLEPLWRTRRFKPEDVEQVVLHAEPAWGSILSEKIETFKAPTTSIGAKINFSYVVALYMARGQAMPGDYTPTALQDPAILTLARRIRFESLPVGAGSHMTLRLRTGETLRVDPQRVSPTAPAPEAFALRQSKFAALTSRLPADARDALWRLAMTAHGEGDARRWARQVARVMAR